jgi:hypothetical protein
MQRRVPVAFDGGTMLGGGVALVAIVAVARVALVKGHHLAITRDFGHDGGGGDGGTLAVAVQHAALCDVEIGNAERIHQHDVRQRRDREYRAPHRLQRCLMDVDGVDLFRIGPGDRPGQCLAGDQTVQTFALGGGDRLRIGKPGNVALRIEDHGTGDDGTGETAPANLIAARDAIEPPTPDGVLEGPHRANTNHE